MTTTRRQILLAAALIGALLGPASATVAQETDQTQKADPWQFDVTPYMWLARIGVETRLPDAPPSTPSSVDRFDTGLAAGAMLAAQARFRSVGVFVDFVWLRFNTEALHPDPAFSAVDLRSDFIRTTTALTYDLPLSGKFHAEVLAGARLWYVNEDLDFKSGTLPGFKLSGDKTLVDPVAGVDLRYDLSPSWFVATKGMAGGFGASSNFTGEVFGGAGYRFNDCCSVTFGYRYLHEDFSQDAFALKLNAHGPLLGFGFHF